MGSLAVFFGGGNTSVKVMGSAIFPDPSWVGGRVTLQTTIDCYILRTFGWEFMVNVGKINHSHGSFGEWDMCFKTDGLEKRCISVASFWVQGG